MLPEGAVAGLPGGRDGASNPAHLEGTAAPNQATIVRVRPALPDVAAAGGSRPRGATNGPGAAAPNEPTMIRVPPVLPVGAVVRSAFQRAPLRCPRPIARQKSLP